jgi:hypothetical protein
LIMVDITGWVTAHIVPSFSKKFCHRLKLGLGPSFVQRPYQVHSL